MAGNFVIIVVGGCVGLLLFDGPGFVFGVMIASYMFGYDTES